MSYLSIIIASAGLSMAVGTASAAPDKEACALCASKSKAMDAPGGHDHAAMQDGHAKMEMKAALPVVDASLYKKADWPAHNAGEGLYAKDFQGKKLPVPLGNETWVSEKVNLEGKVIILDFWATWCPPCRAAMPILNKMQKADSEDLAVVAIGGQREDESTVRSFVEEHKEAITNLYDADQSVFLPFESEGIPLVVVLSTDGVIRWIGNPHDPAFKPAVKKVLDNDPLIQAKS